MALQPVGPLPASTYWRRRVVLGVAALGVLLIVAKACGGGAATKAAQIGRAASPTPSRAVSAAPSPVVAPPPASASPAPLQTCPDVVLEVTTQSDAEAYRSGATPRFTLTVRNTGTVACLRALGPAAVELRVFSGEDRIWSSDDCSTSKEQGVQTLPAGAARATTILWSGKRSKPGCQSGSTAQPGTYRVSARVGSLIRQGSVFRVTP